MLPMGRLKQPDRWSTMKHLNHLANALGHSAVRRGLNVLMPRSRTPFKRLDQSRADHSFGKELVELIRPHVLVIDDFGLQRLTSSEA